MSVHHQATAHLLRATMSGPLERAGHDPHHDSFSVPLALGDLADIAGTLGDGERCLYHAALDIWNGQGDAELGNLIRALDDDAFRALLEALVILRPKSTPTQLDERERLVLVEVLDGWLRLYADIGVHTERERTRDVLRGIREKIRATL